MYCMHCGEEIPDSSRFCKYCGKNVEEAAKGFGENKTERATVTPSAVTDGEKYETVDGFFFREVSFLKKFIMLILAAVMTLIVAAGVFAGTYPDLASQVWNIIR